MTTDRLETEVGLRIFVITSKTLRISTGYIKPICSLESKLSFDCICSVEILYIFVVNEFLENPKLLNPDLIDLSKSIGSMSARLAPIRSRSRNDLLELTSFSFKFIGNIVMRDFSIWRCFFFWKCSSSLELLELELEPPVFWRFGFDSFRRDDELRRREAPN